MALCEDLGGERHQRFIQPVEAIEMVAAVTISRDDAEVARRISSGEPLAVIAASIAAARIAGETATGKPSRLERKRRPLASL